MKVIVEGMNENGRTTYREIKLELSQQTHIGLLPGDTQVIVRLDEEGTSKEAE
jgi:hypothetical protein